MMDLQWKKNWMLPVAAALLGGLLAGAFHHWNGMSAWGVLVKFSVWLRNLSLSGARGNAAAWGIVIVLSLLPGFGLLWRGRQRADWLLFLAGAEVFVGLYFLVNPTLVFPMELSGIPELAHGWGLVAGGCVLSTLLVWALLRLLRKLEFAPARLLPQLLLWAALAYGFFLCAAAVWDVLSEIDVIAAANTDKGRVITSGVLLGVLALMELFPSLLGAWVLLWGRSLAEALDAAPFAEKTVVLAETVAQRCVLVAKVSLLTAAGCNLLRLLTVPVAASTHVHIYLPLITLSLCAALLLLCRYFRRAKAVSDDADSII